MSVAGLRNGDPARHGLEGIARRGRARARRSGVPVPVAAGFGNGGDGATGGGAGGFSGAAELYSQTVWLRAERNACVADVRAVARA